VKFRRRGCYQRSPPASCIHKHFLGYGTCYEQPPVVLINLFSELVFWLRRADATLLRLAISIRAVGKLPPAIHLTILLGRNFFAAVLACCNWSQSGP